MKNKKKKKAEPNPENVLMLLTLYRDYLKQGKDDEDWAELVAAKWKAGEVNEEDILECQKTLPIMAIFEVGNFYHVNEKSGLNFDQARRLACKTQLMYLTKAEKDGRNLRESMKPYEDLIDIIFEGKYDQTKLDILKTLPEHENWDKELGLKHYDTFFK